MAHVKSDIIYFLTYQNFNRILAEFCWIISLGARQVEQKLKIAALYQSVSKQEPRIRRVTSRTTITSDLKFPRISENITEHSRGVLRSAQPRTGSVSLTSTGDKWPSSREIVARYGKRGSMEVMTRVLRQAITPGPWKYQLDDSVIRSFSETPSASITLFHRSILADPPLIGRKNKKNSRNVLTSFHWSQLRDFFHYPESI